MRILRTARRYGVMPCKYLGLPRDPEVDFLLTLALEEYDAGLCAGGCGQHADEAHDPAMEGRYERRSLICQSCAANTPPKDHKPDAGELSYLWRNPKPPRRRGRAAGRPVRA